MYSVLIEPASIAVTTTTSGVPGSIRSGEDEDVLEKRKMRNNTAHPIIAPSWICFLLTVNLFADRRNGDGLDVFRGARYANCISGPGVQEASGYESLSLIEGFLFFFRSSTTGLIALTEITCVDC